MRRLFFLAALLLLAPLAAQAQVYPAPSNVGLAANRPVNCVASNPGQPQEPQWYFATDTSVLSICVATNTWQNTTGGGGGGIGGGGTAPFLSEWTNGTTLGNSLCQDLSTVLLCGESVSVGANAFMISKSNAASGTTQFLAVAWDANRNALTAIPGNSVRGIAALGAGTSGTVQIAIGGEYPWICDNQTVVNDWLVLSTTTAGECHDAGATEPTGVQNIAQVAGANTGSDTATLADIFTPDTVNAPAGPPTVIQVNGAPLASNTGNFNSTTPAAPANSQNVPFATDGLSPSGISAAVPQATAAQAGILQLATDLGGSYSAPNVVGIQGIPCTLNGTPAAGQVWGFTSPTACANLFLGVGVRTFSIATDTILSTDRESWVLPTHSGTVATALPCSFGSNFAYATLNLATGINTETPSGCNINGGASIGILPNWFTLHAFDNSNYFAAAMPTAAAFPSCADSAGNHLNFTSGGGITCGSSSGGSGLSGMTAGQVPIAATASTVTSSKALQGTDASILSSGTVSGTGAALCTDANGGATTSGCSSGGVTSVGLSEPGEFSVSNSPVTSSGTLTVTKSTQNPNTVWAGPISSANSNFVQTNFAQAQTTPSGHLAVSYSSGNVATDLLVATATYNCITHATCNGGGVPTLTDTAGNTWTLAQHVNANSAETDIWYVCSAIAGANTVTLTTGQTGSASGTILTVAEYNGNATTSCTDVANTTNGSAQTLVSLNTSGGVNQATELVIATSSIINTSNCTSPPAMSMGSTYSNIGSQINQCDSNADEWQLLSAAQNATTSLSGAQNVTVSFSPASQHDAVLIQTFKLNASGSAQPTFRQLVNSDLPAHSPATVYTNTNLAQAAAISDTTMIVPVASQLFRFTAEINCTGSSSAATATLNLKWTDTSNTAQTQTSLATCTTLGAASIANIVTAIRAKLGTGVTYGVTISNTPTYDVDVRLEQMN